MRASIIVSFASTLGLPLTIAVAITAILATVIARWKIFTKAGQAGWKSLIPVYSDYVQWSIAWRRKWMFWLMFLFGIAAAVMSIAIAGTSLLDMYTDMSVPDLRDPWFAILGVALSIVTAFLSIIAMYKLFKSFGHGAGWLALWVLFPHVMTIALGFGKSEYAGAC